MAWIFADKDIWPGHDLSYLQELFEIISKRIIMHYDILMHCRLYHLCYQTKTQTVLNTGGNTSIKL